MSSSWVAPTPALVASFEPVNPTSIIIVGAILPSLAIVAVCLRFWCRSMRKIGLEYDDWSILCALVLCVGTGILLITGSALDALGQPTPIDPRPGDFADVNSQSLVIAEKIKYAFNLMQALAFGCIKYSVVFFYRRIFRGKSFDIWTKSLLVLVTLWTFGFFFTVMFECGSNFWAFWSTLSDLLTYCANDFKFQGGQAISDVTIDILILLTPLPVIWKLQLTLGNKLAVSAVFLLGFLAVAFGIVRMNMYFRQLADAFTSSQGILVISTWIYWSTIELGMSIVAACLPTLRPLIGDIGAAGLSEKLRKLLTLRTTFAASSRDKAASSGTTNIPDSLSNSSYTPIHDHPTGENRHSAEIYALDNISASPKSTP